MLFPKRMSLKRFRCRWNRPTTTNDESGVHHFGVRLSIPTNENEPLHVDVAPLKGLHTETIEDVIDFCERHQWIGFQNAVAMASHIDDAVSMPSLSWAVGSSSFDNEVGEVLSAKLHGGIDAPDVKLTKGEVCKLKVGRGNVEEESRLVKQLGQKGVQVRLDANGKCTVAHALLLVESSREFLDFFEEPGAQAVSRLVENLVPLAIDETLFEMWKQGRAHLAVKEHARAVWIVKPSQYGWRGTNEILAEAKKRQARFVISATYEVGKTAQRLGSFAHTIAPLEVHGLGTSESLEPVVWQTHE
ncbi:MAG: hypothetical protein GY822_00765 [Deltaproteobacteria bacterium]|nr:hypothetical protein [Deltaproteobacteria bacterium]